MEILKYYITFESSIIQVKLLQVTPSDDDSGL